ncbi:MAG: hypothetical protein V4508_08675 [Pseudomonadota bacterium]
MPWSPARLLHAAALLLLGAACNVLAAAPLRIVLPAVHPSSQEHAAYFPRLLRLALDHTAATDGPFEIVHYDQPLTSPRQAIELKNNGIINVMWDGSNQQREAELLPIRISLLRQLNDYRVFLIRAEDAPKFGAITTLGQLRALGAGSGVNWPSTEVLRANGLKVVTSIAYEYLFPMLAAKRFDYMPRGVYEAWYEQRAHADQQLVIEQTIFLHYPVPFYFFVSRSNPKLAARIERGLQLSQRDGSFDKLFNSFPAFQRSEAEIAAGKRRVFELRLP